MKNNKHIYKFYLYKSTMIYIDDDLNNNDNNKW
jgi:hypothetical protein